jgi:hypothetical protein
MKTSWQTDADRIVCRWSETGERTQYNPPWLQQASQGVDRSVTLAVPDFASHSPLGSGEWFVPWNGRRNVHGKSII